MCMTVEYAPVHPGDVEETLAGFHGVIPAKAIYERYCEVALSHQRHPGHITAVGQILVRRGLYRRVKKGKTLYSIW